MVYLHDLDQVTRATTALGDILRKHNVNSRFPVNLYIKDRALPIIGLPWDAAEIKLHGHLIPDEIEGLPVRFTYEQPIKFALPSKVSPPADPQCGCSDA